MTDPQDHAPREATRDEPPTETHAPGHADRDPPTPDGGEDRAGARHEADPLSAEEDDEEQQRRFWQRLLHRWFVEYNPLALVSAALVLAGVFTVSHALAAQEIEHASVAMGAVTELYALALIGGAAFLMRIGLRRSAAMLGLLAALYQCDLTLRVETYSYLGLVGQLASAGWVVAFVIKLQLLVRALRLRVAPAARLVPSAAALGMALLPHVLPHVGVHARTTLAATLLFATGAAALYTTRRVDCLVGLEVRGRRAIHGTWLVWGALLLAHVLYWVGRYDVSLSGLVPTVALLGLRWMTRERALWGALLMTIAVAAWIAPDQLAATVAAASVMLVLRGYRMPRRLESTSAPADPTEPYRSVALTPPSALPSLVFVVALATRRRRYLGAAVTGGYLSAWTAGWSGGAWPAHLLWLDVAFALVVVAALATARLRLPLLALGGTGAHAAVVSGWVGAPAGALEWGATLIGLGLVALVASLALGWLSQRGRWGEPDPLPRAVLNDAQHVLSTLPVSSSSPAPQVPARHRHERNRP